MQSTGPDKFSKVKVMAGRSKVKSANKPYVAHLRVTMNMDIKFEEDTISSWSVLSRTKSSTDKQTDRWTDAMVIATPL